MPGGIVIVGAGHAGGILADAVRTQGHDGPICLIGDEDTLPYQRPPLSKGYLLGEVSTEQLHLRPSEFYTAKAIELIAGVHVTAIDRAEKQVRLSTGATRPYESLVLATGARPRLLDVPGADLSGIHALRTLADVDAIRADLETAQSCAVIGGGFIGLEIAAVFSKIGKSVTVIEAADRLMGRAVSPAVSDFFLRLHRARGSVVHLSSGVTGFSGDTSRLTGIETSHGTISADLAVVGIGVLPNDALARAADLPVDRGIVVDRAGRTADPAIFAIGDCCHADHALYPDRVRLESVQNAVDQAKLVANAVMGKPADYDVVPWFWSDQFDSKLQIAGLAQPGQTHQVYEDETAGTLAVYHFDNNRLAAAETVNRARDHMSARRLISADAPPDAATVEAAGGDLMAVMKKG